MWSDRVTLLSSTTPSSFPVHAVAPSPKGDTVGAIGLVKRNHRKEGRTGRGCPPSGPPRALEFESVSTRRGRGCPSLCARQSVQRRSSRPPPPRYSSGETRLTEPSGIDRRDSPSSTWTWGGSSWPRAGSVWCIPFSAHCGRCTCRGSALCFSHGVRLNICSSDQKGWFGETSEGCSRGRARHTRSMTTAWVATQHHTRSTGRAWRRITSS